MGPLRRSLAGNASLCRTLVGHAVQLSRAQTVEVMGEPTPQEADTGLPRLIGPAAIAFSALYVVSDLMELAAGRLYTGQLIVTYIAEASIPFFVLGLHSVQQPRGAGRAWSGR